MPRLCEVAECTKPHVAKGLCNTHYRRMYRRGTVEPTVVFHSMSRTSEYKTWGDIINRTENPKDPGYKNYGARGIKMSDSWRKSFTRFYADMGERPDGMTLDRIDVNGDYSKENCRWATKSVQIINRRLLSLNTSGYTGINRTSYGSWQVSISANYKTYYLGTYKKIEEAIKARKDGEAKYHEPLIRKETYATS